MNRVSASIPERAALWGGVSSHLIPTSLEQYLACADSTYYEDIQVLLKTLNHLLLSHAATPTQHWLVKFWNFLCSALGACFILFCPLKGHLMLWS